MNHLARFEQYLLEPRRRRLHDFQSMIRNELPHETYLEIAVYYANLRLDGDALRVLKAAPDQATVRYWQAYLLRDKSPAESRQVLERPPRFRPIWCFRSARSRFRYFNGRPRRDRAIGRQIIIWG